MCLRLIPNTSNYMHVATHPRQYAERVDVHATPTSRIRAHLNHTSHACTSRERTARVLSAFVFVVA